MMSAAQSDPDRLSSKSRIRYLATKILENVDEIDARLVDQNLPWPSFQNDAMDNVAGDLLAAQNSLLEATDELTALIQGPRRMLSGFAFEHNRASSIHAIIRFKLAAAFPPSSTTTFADLSKATHIDKADIEQIIRHAMTYRIFCEKSPGVIGHTASSRLLATSTNFVDFVRVAFDELLPASSRMIDAMERWPSSQEPNQTGWNIANRTSESMFVALSTKPERAARFASSMRGFLETPPFSPEHLINGYPWGDIKKMVDVGGSDGAIALALAKRFDNLECVVQDLSDTGPRNLTTSHELSNRVRFQSHDFFQTQPIRDADVYLLRFVLHDWSDKYASKIIRELVPALEDGHGRHIIINDTCLPDNNAGGALEERNARASSLAMKAIQNGRERNLEDWKNVLRLADPRLFLEQSSRPEGSAFSVLVVGLKTALSV